MLVRRIIASVLDHMLLCLAFFATIRPVVQSADIWVRSIGIGPYDPWETHDAYYAIIRFSGLFLALALMFSYFCLFELTSWRATPAKLLFGLRVIGKDAKEPTFLQIIGRALSRCFFLSINPFPTFAPFYLPGIVVDGFFGLFKTMKYQALHDMVAKTTVVDRRQVS